MSDDHLAVFADFENVALGARDEGLSFDVSLVMGRLLEKGHVVVKRAYADWNRYAGHRKALHQAGFELVEVPHVSYGGKNSADIRMVVDAIDLCHTKDHVSTFALVTGDSDFSPLAAKLRENGRRVLGLGVKASTSSLLVESCDDFTYYDDLVRERSSASGRGDRNEAVALFARTAEALLRDRDQPVFGSHVKQVLKRKKPGFNESWYGFRGLNQLIEAASADDAITVRKHDASGGYLVLDAAS